MRTLVAAIALAALRAPAHAGTPGFGPRAGVTKDPHSIFVGAHANFDDLGDIAHLRLQPSLELGYGSQDAPIASDYVTVRLNGNFAYLIPLGGRDDMFFYPVSGLSVYYLDYRDCSGDCDNTELGIDLGVGFEVQRLAVEVWLGFDDKDLPDITLAVSYTFR